jgi:hypothetical protein
LSDRGKKAASFESFPCRANSMPPPACPAPHLCRLSISCRASAGRGPPNHATGSSRGANAGPCNIPHAGRLRMA